MRILRVWCPKIWRKEHNILNCTSEKYIFPPQKDYMTRNRQWFDIEIVQWKVKAVVVGIVEGYVLFAFNGSDPGSIHNSLQEGSSASGCYCN